MLSVLNFKLVFESCASNSLLDTARCRDAFVGRKYDGIRCFFDKGGVGFVLTSLLKDLTSLSKEDFAGVLALADACLFENKSFGTRLSFSDG